MQRRLFIILWAIFLAFPSMAFAGSRGYAGVAFAAEAEGRFWDPIVKSLKVTTVIPKSPADLSGVTVGDELLEIAGRPVVGAKGKDLMALMEKNVGDAVQIKIKRANGEILVVTMTLVNKFW